MSDSGDNRELDTKFRWRIAHNDAALGTSQPQQLSESASLGLSRNRHDVTSPHRLRDLAGEIAKKGEDHTIVLGKSQRGGPSNVFAPYQFAGSAQPIGLYWQRAGGEDFDFKPVPVRAKRAALRFNRRQFGFRTTPHHKLLLQLEFNLAPKILI
jgi:hypothetical protein